MERINFNQYSFLITGGTGSFGMKMISKLLKLNVKEIRVLSRDEKKQSDLKKIFNQSIIKYFVGDIRDKQSLFDAFNGVDYVFHAAALKQVDTLEKFPLEAVKTNLIGTENVIECAIENNVKKVVLLSTDKAVNPVNAMGMSKALMEKLVFSKTLPKSNTKLILTRFGNVIATRGSVIPYFIQLLQNRQKIKVTNSEMTRFLMSLDDAINLVLYAFEYGEHHDLFVPKPIAAKLLDLIKAIENITNLNAEIQLTGIRPGEKIHEELLTEDEMNKAVLVQENLYLVTKNAKQSSHLNTKKLISNEHLITHEELVLKLQNNLEIKELLSK